MTMLCVWQVVDSRSANLSMGAAPIKLSVKVVPGSSRAGLSEWLGDTLKVRVSAPPERGKANKAVERLLAESLEISPKSVHVVTGKTSARKIVEIAGLSEQQVSERLARVVG